VTAPRCQLWKEEAAILAGFAAAVPQGGTIVEIGTAEGATARLMHEACAGREITIVTIDIAPSRIAIDTLAGTGVRMVAQASEAAAAEWAGRVGRKIDFLFIDGNHDLEHVVTDWNLWTPELVPGGRVALHDFDPPRRGGLAHFAVRVGGETLARTGRLRVEGHDFKLLHGRVDDPAATAISAGDCLDTLAAIATGVRAVLAGPASAIATADDPRLAALARAALDGSASAGAGSVTIDSLTACYLAEQALRRNYPGLAELASAHGDFLAWGEAVQMLDHGWRGPRFPFSLPDAGMTLAELSSYVAREHVRLVLLSRLLALLVDWRP
jgi:hypothetical protein